jgi:hypothetical protein
VLRRWPKDSLRVFVGWDDAEALACQVAAYTLHRQARTRPVRMEPIAMDAIDNYRRPTTRMPSGQLYDELSDAPMSTSHAIARFWLPRLCNHTGWALFTDGDVIFREDVSRLFDLADPQYALMVVQHGPMPEASEKKRGHVQQPYPRKNWSSVMLWNCGHLAHRELTVEVLNSWPGRDLHAFKWLRDDHIGALPARWNHLVGVSAPDPNPALVHYTLGTPDVDGHEDDLYADEWRLAARVGGYEPSPVAFHADVGPA